MIQERRQRGNEKRKKTNVDIGGLATFILLLFRVPLGVLVTDETNGYLAIAWEIYSLFYLFFGFACSEIVSQLVRDRVEKGVHKNSLRSMHTMMIAGSFLACLGAVILYGTSGYLLALFPGKKQVEISLLLFAFLLPFSTWIGLFRGYFAGIRNEGVIKLSRLVEAIITLSGVFIFVFIFQDYGSKVADLLHNPNFQQGFGAAGVVAGYLFGAVLSLLFLLFFYILHKTGYNRLLKKDLGRSIERKGKILKEGMGLLPAILLPIFLFKFYSISNLWIYGQQMIKQEEILRGIGVIGSYYGKTLVWVSLAVVFVLFLCEDQRRRGKSFILSKDVKSDRQRIGEQVKKLFAVTIPVGGSMVILSETLLKAVYDKASRTDYRMLAVGGITVIFISLGIFGYRLLTQLSCKKQIVFIQAVAFFLQFVCMLFLVKLPAVGNIQFTHLSMGLSQLVFWVIYGSGQLLLLLKFFRLRLPLSNFILVPLLKTLVMMVVQLMLLFLLGKAVESWMLLWLTLGIGIVCYQLLGRTSFFGSNLYKK